MLTKLTIRNFKRFNEAEIELAEPVVLVGPNNSGKTTALQALALWDIGLRIWADKRGLDDSAPEKRSGISINRKDLFSLPVPSALLLWNDLHVRAATKNDTGRGTENVRIEILVEGIASGTAWTCGLEFDYANDESLYCRPLRTSAGKNPARMTVPQAALATRVAFLPPMSGLADREFVKQRGEVEFLIGQGQTAQVLRNLCHDLYSKNSGKIGWNELVARIRDLFGVELLPPELVPARSEIVMSYREPKGTTLDLSSSGRGMQQTLLLIVYLYANPGSVLLLDEPDAHLEILRQRQTFNLISEIATAQNSQIVAASHSEVVMNEAAARGRVVAFVGRPHVINDRGSQVLKALKTIGFDQYYQAEQMGWVLYLEDSTDLDILRAFARALAHPVLEYLEAPFLHPVGNQPQHARNHFHGLLEAKGDLVGLALFDRLERSLQSQGPLVELMWRKREIENYLCTEQVLLGYAASDTDNDLFGQAERDRRTSAMRESISKIKDGLRLFSKPDPWSPDIKASDEFLDPLFKEYSVKLGVPLTLRKNEYYKLSAFLPAESIDAEISEKLDAILEVARRAKPGGS